MSKVAIIGATGKLGTTFVRGLIHSGYDPSSIEVILREGTKYVTPLAYLTSTDVRCSTDIHRIADATSIVVMVPPTELGDVLKKFSYVSFTGKEPKEVIFIVSGSSQRDISKFTFKGVNARTIIATGNTNIESCNGVICSTSYSPLLARLGKLVVERPHWVAKSVLTTGSANAITCAVLPLQYEQAKNVSLYSWLFRLQEILATIEQEDSILALLPKEKHYDGLFEHMTSLCTIYQKVLLYKRRYAEKCIVMNVLSTVRNLLSQGELVSIESITRLISTVTTPGGCTEKGVRKIIKLSQARSALFLERQVVVPINNRRLMFHNEVHESIKNALKVENNEAVA